MSYRVKAAFVLYAFATLLFVGGVINPTSGSPHPLPTIFFPLLVLLALPHVWVKFREGYLEGKNPNAAAR